MSNQDFSEYRNEDGTFRPEFYDEQYYENGPQSGKGWLSNYHWMPRRTFKEAYALIDYMELNDDSFILDFGCAKGFIVKALRLLDIKADGCDISNYALSFAPKGCWNSSYPGAWGEHKNLYSHITVKDVLEHLTKEQLYGILDKMAIVAPKMMCVVPMGDYGIYRIPEYHTEVSHLIVENEGWWRYQFFNAGWHIIKETNHVPGLKDNWMHIPDGNHVFYLEKR